MINANAALNMEQLIGKGTKHRSFEKTYNCPTIKQLILLASPELFTQPC